MEKENIHKFIYFVCILFIIGFCVRLGADYLKYDTINNSAPFYTFLITRSIECLLPCVLLFVIAKVIKKKYDKK